MDTFIDALRYSQTLVNTANAGADLAFDFLRSYDYYGSVRMAVATNTEISAEAITLRGYNTDDFFTYDALEMADYFYASGDTILGTVKVVPIGNANDSSLLTREIINDMSIIKDGSIDTKRLSYDAGVTFDAVNDDDNTIFPIGVYDTLYYKVGDTIDINSASWDVKLRLTSGIIKKLPDTSIFDMTNVSIGGGISSANISFSSHLEEREEILKNVIREDGRILSSAVIDPSISDGTNIFTLRKLESMNFKTVGDSIELHLETEYTDAELKAKVDAFMETSGSALVYDGEDAFLTQAQADMIAEYIFRKVTSISKSNIQI